MGTNNISIKIFKSVDEAPIYREPEFKAVSIETACIVKGGTVGGNPTVDLVMIDSNGQKYVGMLTGRILNSITLAVGGTNEGGH